MHTEKQTETHNIDPRTTEYSFFIFIRHHFMPFLMNNIIKHKFEHSSLKCKKNSFTVVDILKSQGFGPYSCHVCIGL